MDPRWNPASKVKKRGSDTGDTNTQAYCIIAPTRKMYSVSVVTLYCANDTCSCWVLLHAIEDLRLNNWSDSPPPPPPTRQTGWVGPGFTHVGIMPDDATGRLAFLGISRLRCPCIPALFHTQLAPPSSALKTSMLRATQIRPFHSVSLMDIKNAKLCYRSVAARGAGMKRWEEREVPVKTRRPTASSGTIPTCENPVTRPGIEPGSPWESSSVNIIIDLDKRDSSFIHKRQLRMKFFWDVHVILKPRKHSLNKPSPGSIQHIAMFKERYYKAVAHPSVRQKLKFEIYLTDGRKEKKLPCDWLKVTTQGCKYASIYLNSDTARDTVSVRFLSRADCTAPSGLQTQHALKPLGFPLSFHLARSRRSFPGPRGVIALRKSPGSFTNKIDWPAPSPNAITDTALAGRWKAALSTCFPRGRLHTAVGALPIHSCFAAACHATAKENGFIIESVAEWRNPICHDMVEGPDVYGGTGDVDKRTLAARSPTHTRAHASLTNGVVQKSHRIVAKILGGMEYYERERVHYRDSPRLADMSLSLRCFNRVGGSLSRLLRVRVCVPACSHSESRTWKMNCLPFLAAGPYQLGHCRQSLVQHSRKNITFKPVAQLASVLVVGVGCIPRYNRQHVGVNRFANEQPGGSKSPGGIKIAYDCVGTGRPALLAGVGLPTCRTRWLQSGRFSVRLSHWEFVNNLDSTVLCILEPQLCVHWLLPQEMASITPHLAVYGFHYLFSSKSAIVSEASRACLINCDPITKSCVRVLCEIGAIWMGIGAAIGNCGGSSLEILWSGNQVGRRLLAGGLRTWSAPGKMFVFKP
ncbi:hypothetical protein PR048_009539 [Dryococelus australis]|uniref:Uncharacterized protein n=1 Tax=Dryococelus australis TaxID=614101 RepID=A0ABQ9I207_9NEOP|nr:hypothetical protein PR048_009539 [Dryococelus australis]